MLKTDRLLFRKYGVALPLIKQIVVIIFQNYHDNILCIFCNVTDSFMAYKRSKNNCKDFVEFGNVVVKAKQHSFKWLEQSLIFFM